MDALRICLHEITENGQPALHPQQIAGLRPEFPHSIEVMQGEAAIDKYTCVPFALGLVGNQEYIAIVEVAPLYVFASPAFVQRLIDRGALQPRSQASEGALIVYLDDEGRVQHIGRMIEAERVESKWGGGHQYQHGIFEVPASYGSAVAYFEPITADDAVDHFADYAEEHGVQFE